MHLATHIPTTTTILTVLDYHLCAMDSEPAAKRQKIRKGTKASRNVINLPGGKTISLESYLAPERPRAADPVKQKISTTTAAAAAENEEPRPASSDAKTAARDRSHRPRSTGGNGKSNKLSAVTVDDALAKARHALPIARHKLEIQRALKSSSSDVLILVGETGSGKSTQVPQFLFEQKWCKQQKVKLPGSNSEINVGGKIAITQPRRVAATTLAHRVSKEVDSTLGSVRRKGESVGYSVRFDHKVPRGARIKFLTEGMLLQELLRDPNLREYSAVIVDEIHERSLDVDLLVGFLKQILSGDKAGRGGVPLKVVIMSATAEVEMIQEFFSDHDVEKTKSAVEVLRIEGRQYPVQTIYEPQPVLNIDSALVDKIVNVHKQEQFPGDILAFFVGQEQIEIAQKLIEERANDFASNIPMVKVVPLYGQLSIEAQRDAFFPVRAPFTRKIVLATNIAETSVTVPGVRYVVDCGKAKVKQFRTRLGMESLLVKPISKSSAIQRKGRAGREGPGKCFRLYTEEGYDGLREADLPEILRNDVLGAVMTMKARGIQDVVNFPLMDAPDVEGIKKAMFHLHFLGAIDELGNMTEDGHKMARLPVPAPQAAVLLAAARPEYDCVLEAIDVISLITAGGDIFLQVQDEEKQEELEDARKELQRREGDIITLLTTMQQYAAENTDRIEWCKHRGINGRNMRQSIMIRRQLRGLCVTQKLLEEAPPPDPQPFIPISPQRAETVIRCFLRGFADKTAILMPDASYATTEGKHTVAIHPSSVLHGKRKEAIMFLEHVFTRKNYAKKVSAIQAQWILDAIDMRHTITL